MSHFARQTVKVCLTGDGGDESFGGYRRALVARYGELWRKLVPDSVKLYLAEHYDKDSHDTNWLQKLDRLNSASFGVGFDNINAISWEDMLEELLGDGLIDSLPQYRQAYTRKNSRPLTKSPLSLIRQTMLDDFTNQLPYDFLTKVDVASMSGSLEIRTPFLDHHLVEYAWNLQDRYKVRIGETKWFLKRLASLYIPNDVIYRKKMGFALPMKIWWKHQLKDLLQDLLSTSRAVGFGWIKKKPVQRVLDEHVHGKRAHDTRLWLILCLELWARIVVERSMGRGSLEIPQTRPS